MSGYPTPPGPRIAYDLDGSIGFVGAALGTVGLTQVHPRFLRALNADSPRVAIVQMTNADWDYSTNPGVPFGDRLAIRFPEPIRIRAIGFAAYWGASNPAITFTSFYNGDNPATAFAGQVETSADSTNGEDGTWRALYGQTKNDLFPFSEFPNDEPARADETYGYVTHSGAEGVQKGNVLRVNSEFRKESTGPDVPGWRAVTGLATRQVTWLRFKFNPQRGLSTGSTSPPGTTMGIAYKLHLYGEPDTAAGTDRLIFTDVSGNPKTSFDWGDIGRSSTHTQTFKVKNLSSTKTAEGVSVGVQLPDPSVLEAPQTWLKLSLDGVIWSDTVLLPDLAPGASSGTITLRVQAGTTMAGPSGPRLSAEVEEWV